MTETLHQEDEEGIRALLLGHRIVAAEEGAFPLGPGKSWRGPATGRLTLDDGTQVLVVPNEGGCSCGAGDYELASVAAVDNIITDVRLENAPLGEDYRPKLPNGQTDWDTPGRYRIYVVADAQEINVVDIEGDDGNGYYGTGYELIVVRQDTPSA